MRLCVCVVYVFELLWLCACVVCVTCAAAAFVTWVLLGTSTQRVTHTH